ncbi:MAG TPA: hypothetical protein VH583_10750 [Vicinamibacterales bacterium]|jgi:hypothetical protein
MPVVRYVVLAALVVWLGDMVQGLFGDALRDGKLVAAVCGGVIVAGLVVMKFVGPPPQAFLLRVGLAIVMTAITAFAAFRGSAPMLAFGAGLGFVLLGWYARE